MTCGSCHWWRRREGQSGGCRRNAPVVIADGPHAGRVAFPGRREDAEACGEFHGVVASTSEADVSFQATLLSGLRAIWLWAGRVAE